MSDPRWLRAAPALVLVFTLALAFTNLGLRLATEQLNHDELEHVHAAWLLEQGQRPYQDFFEHHPPHYWQFLRVGLRLFGEGAIFHFGRVAMLVCFAGSLLFTGLLARELLGPGHAVPAVAVLAVNRLVQHPALTIRPDGFMVLLSLAGAWLFLRSWREGLRPAPAAVAGLLLGLGFAVHPRAGFTVLALALAAGHDLWWRLGRTALRQRWAGLLAFAACAALPIIQPFVSHGPEVYFHWVYRVSAAAQPSFWPWLGIGNLVVGGFALLPFALLSVGQLVLEIRRDPRASTGQAALLLLCAINLGGILIATRPFVQAFYPLVPFVAILVARSVSSLCERLGPLRRPAALSLFVLAALLSQLQPKRWKLTDDLPRQLDRIAGQCRELPAEASYVGELRAHPIFRPDGTFYWFDFDVATFRRLDPAWQHDWVAELERTRPALVWRGPWGKGIGPEEEARIQAWLARRYRPLDEGPFLVPIRPAEGPAEAALEEAGD